MRSKSLCTLIDKKKHNNRYINLTGYTCAVFLLHFLLKTLTSIPSVNKINGLKKHVLYKCLERGQRKKKTSCFYLYLVTISVSPLRPHERDKSYNTRIKRAHSSAHYAVRSRANISYASTRANTHTRARIRINRSYICKRTSTSHAHTHAHTHVNRKISD